MRSLVRGALPVLLALAGAAPAAAAPQWLPPHDVTTSAGAVATPSVASDALGTVVAVWLSDQAVLSSSRPAAVGAWEPPHTLSAAGASGPQIAVTPAGTAIAVWVL